jgi:hypothetical protein
MSPLAGRFLGRDPIGNSGGYHLYQIYHGNSLAKLDPSGWVTITTIDDTISHTQCAGPGAGPTTYGMVYQFRVENKCANKSGWIIQEIVASCVSGDCSKGTCPVNKAKAKSKTYYEAWRVSGTVDSTKPDQEASGDYDYTDTSTLSNQVQFETCGYQKAVGVVRFLCDEDIPMGESPADWLTNLLIDVGDKGCPLFTTGGLPTSEDPPTYWNKSKEPEANRFYEIEWNCCCDADSFGIKQDGAPRASK